jgi:hypothetical protein
MSIALSDAGKAGGIRHWQGRSSEEEATDAEHPDLLG